MTTKYGWFHYYSGGKDGEAYMLYLVVNNSDLQRIP